MNDTSSNDYKIAAVDRALLVLEALADKPGQGVTSLSKSMGLTKSIVFRLLQTLEDRGFVFRDPEQAVYSLGYRIGVLGERVGRDGSLLFAARPVMDMLRDRTSENVNLVIREGLRSLVLATRSGHHSIRLFAQAGRNGPLHAGGGSLCILAYCDESVINAVLGSPLEAFTPYTITDPEKLRQTLSRIRTNGHNIALNDLDDGAFSVAAPIVGANGEVIAAISVAGAMVRFDEERRETYIRAAMDAAAEISSKLSLHRIETAALPVAS
ncbi:IclR family transcriptional regulator [Mesorhizobium sp. YR577]|jgi:IclR family KDG regulon transcriptional repressor|uniref:IclR family transcriptional regulator n=1 Tax=Mesorhizobium sp. YR577 TaxID=1884373 RepID=UPI0008EA2F2F|nr:IclR family transcriptional regulator [Mesorhizobium sp. YR577]SFT55407.1 transcriptional regulator, IclR family [Mesorhizobium sp. YR577]